MPPLPIGTIAFGSDAVRAELAEARARRLEAESGVFDWRIQSQKKEVERLSALVEVLT